MEWPPRVTSQAIPGINTSHKHICGWVCYEAWGKCRPYWLTPSSPSRSSWWNSQRPRFLKLRLQWSACILKSNTRRPNPQQPPITKKKQQWLHERVEDFRGVNSSYHICTNMSVRRGIIWGTSVYSIQKGEVLIFTSVYI